MSEEILPRQLGRYRLLRRIGEGSMASVYRAVLEGPHGFENEVAIKLVHPELLAAYPKVVKMAVDEARIAARLHHPNIVRILDLVEEEGCFYMVMDYVDGVSMRVVLDAARELSAQPPLGPILEVLAAACDGLHAAHGLCRADGTRLNLVHRDVKPDNIMVSMDGEVKVGDFGIATFVDRVADATAQGQLKGTPAYMAPEQTLGGPLDARTDVFSMGLTLYTLATTELAFRAKKPVGVALKIARESLEPHADRLDALLPALGDVFRKACARDPDTRFADAAEMAQALRDVHASITRPQSVSAMLEMARRGAEGEPTDPAPETPTTGATDAISIDLMGPSIVEDEDEKLGHAEGARFSVGVRPEAQGGTELSVQDTDPAADSELDAQETDPTDRFPAPRPKTEPKAEQAAHPDPKQDPSTTTGLELERAQDMPVQDPAPGQQVHSTMDGSSEAEPHPTEANTDDDDTVPPVAAPHATPGPTGAWAPPTVPAQAMSAATVPGQPAPTRGALAPPQPTRPQSTGSMLGAPAPNAVGSASPAQGLPERDYRGRVVRRTKAPENIDVGRKEKVGIAIAVGGLAMVVVALLVSLLVGPSEKSDTELPVQTPADLGLGPLAKRDPGDQGQRAQETLPKQPRSRFLSQQEGEADKATNSTPKPETKASAGAKPAPASPVEKQNSQAATKGARPDRATKAPRTPSRAAGARPKQPERATEDAQPTSTVGSITVNSYPWSRIYIDGEDMGRTPLKARTLEVGVHTVELVFPTQGDKRFSKRVEIRPDREERVVHRLTESVNE